MQAEFDKIGAEFTKSNNYDDSDDVENDSSGENMSRKLFDKISSGLDKFYGIKSTEFPPLRCLPPYNIIDRKDNKSEDKDNNGNLNCEDPPPIRDYVKLFTQGKYDDELSDIEKIFYMMGRAWNVGTKNKISHETPLIFKINNIDVIQNLLKLSPDGLRCLGYYAQGFIEQHKDK